MCFRFELCISPYSGRSSDVPFLRRFLYDLPFWSYSALKPPIIFLMAVARCFLVPNDNFHCQTPSMNTKFDLFGSAKCQLTNLVANRDWLIVTVLKSYRLRHASSSNGMTAYIRRRFIPTTAFLVSYDMCFSIDYFSLCPSVQWTYPKCGMLRYCFDTMRGMKWIN